MQPDDHDDQPVLRPMAAADAEALLAIAQGSGPAAPNWSLADYRQISLSDPLSAFHRFAVVADSGGLLAGFAVAGILRIEERATLESIVVHPRFQRRGIGAAVAVSIMRAAAAAGARMMALEVRESNVAALGLYRKQGFQQRGRRRAYYSAPSEDALLFEVSLTGPGLLPRKTVAFGLSS